MAARHIFTTSVFFLAIILTAKVAHALGFDLGETKAALKLDYQLEMTDHKTGRVTYVLTIKDEGRLEPLSGIDLVIPDETGSGRPELSVSLEATKTDGKRVVRVHLLKDLAKRGYLMLKTWHLDGKQTPLTWYYHTVPLGELLKEE